LELAWLFQREKERKAKVYNPLRLLGAGSYLGFGQCVTEELLTFMWKCFGIKRDIILHYGLWLLLFLGTIISICQLLWSEAGFLGFMFAGLSLFCSFLCIPQPCIRYPLIVLFSNKIVVSLEKRQKRRENDKYTHPLHVQNFQWHMQVHYVCHVVK
jgi:hypothetical protein